MDKTIQYLPPDLRALHDFDVWAEATLRAEESKTSPKAPLYHYTKGVGLEGILKHQELWCFSHKCQSDPLEYQFALQRGKEVLKGLRKSKNKAKVSFYGCLIDLLGHNDVTADLEFYLSSLTQHRDEYGQWINYGDEGQGFAIGFSPSLFQPDQRLDGLKPNEIVVIGQVVYGQRLVDERHSVGFKRAAKIISNFARQFPELREKVQAAAFLDAMAKRVLTLQMIWNCVTSKEAKFKHEEEVRCVIMNLPTLFDPYRSFIGGRPYIKTPLPLKRPGSLTEILIGPNAPSDAEVMVPEFLKANGYTYPVPIVRSQVTAGGGRSRRMG